MTQERVRTVWFYRDYQGLTGGQVKHSHYFGHVLRMPGFAPKITFRGEPLNESHALERRALWPAGDEGPAARWEPGRRDVLFLAGMDWRFLAESGLESLPNPRINLIQGIRHAHERTELHRYLARRAIRICVSREIADAISATGRVEGPILTIPNGIDVQPTAPAEEDLAAAHRARPRPITILGYKRPGLARALSRRFDEEHIAHPPATEFLDRRRFLERLAESRVAVCLPLAEEGFYLPALEAMAAGCLVVTLDCIGNRGFCRHEENCLIAGPGLDSLFDAAKKALALPAPEREGLLRRARDTAAGHSLDTERARFHAVLEDVDRLWRTDRQDGEAGAAESPGPSRPDPPMPNAHRPRPGFAAEPAGSSQPVPTMPDTHRPRPGFAAEPAGSSRPSPEMPDAHRPRPGFAAEPAGPSRPDPPMPDAHRPRLGFMIVGAQKCGTTALARFLSRHPEIGMANPKEAHLFDAPDYSGGWSPKEIDARYRPSFEHCPAATIRGEATPIYMLLPEVARELHRYNPDLKLIVLLRDPVERAISHYYMERARGDERLPLWLALLSEPFRLRRCRDARQADSAMRRHSYRRRGLYSLQLRNLYRHFDRGRVLIIRTQDLLRRHDAVLRQVFAFLGVSGDVRIAPERVYPDVPGNGGRHGRPHRAVSCLLRLSYLAESARLRAFLSSARIESPMQLVR